MITLTQTQVNQLYSMIQIFLDICKKLEINVWTSGGTTLGALRHQGLIPWDDDADFCVTTSPLQMKKLFEELVREGLRLENTCSSSPPPPDPNCKWFHISDKFQECHCGGQTLNFPGHYSERSSHQASCYCVPQLDVFVLEQNDNIYELACLEAKQMWPKEIQHTNDTITKKFGPILVPVNQNAEFQLSEMYGENWKHEAKMWNHFCPEPVIITPTEFLPFLPHNEIKSQSHL